MTTDRWRLTQEAFERLLGQLGSDAESAAREYETIRRRLIDLFDWRGVVAPEALADETLDRVARKLDEGERVEHLRAYCYGVARRVVLEWEKRRAREAVALRELSRRGPHEPATDAEARVAALESCLRQMPAGDRELIVEYYRGEGKAHLPDRRALAARLGVTYVTLKTRAHRIRARLEAALRGGSESEIGVTNEGREPPSDEGGVEGR